MKISKEKNYEELLFCYLCSGATDPCSVKSPDCVLCVSLVLELNEGETWWVPGNPDILQLPVLFEGILDLVFGGGVAQVSDVNLAGQVPLAVMRHGLVYSDLQRR